MKKQAKTPPKKQQPKLRQQDDYQNQDRSKSPLQRDRQKVEKQIQPIDKIGSHDEYLRKNIYCLIEFLDSSINEDFLDSTIAHISVRQLKEILEDNLEILPLLKIETDKLEFIKETFQQINSISIINNYEVLDQDLFYIIKILKLEKIKTLIKNDDIIQSLLEENKSVSETILIQIYDGNENWLKLVANQRFKVYSKELLNQIIKCMTVRNGFWNVYFQLENMPFIMEIYDKAKLDMLNIYNLEILNFVYKSIIMENNIYNQLSKDGNLFHLLNNRLQKQSFDEDLYQVLKILQYHIVRFGVTAQMFESGFMDSLSQQMSRSNLKQNFSKLFKIMKIIEFRLQNIEEHSKDIKWYFVIYEKLIHQSLDVNVAFESTENLYQMLKNTDLSRYTNQFQQIFTIQFREYLMAIDNDYWISIVQAIFQL
ncbi:hypothetical protein pb186bvf_013061 [Paramecium bursaria]